MRAARDRSAEPVAPELGAVLGAVKGVFVTQEELEAKATAAGVHWQVVSYALSRETRKDVHLPDDVQC